MKRFAELLDRLAYTPSRNDKLRLLAGYFAATPDPDHGWALAALTDGLFFRLPLRRILGEMIEARIDPVLFGLSRDYVGDTAETIALIWPGADASVETPRLDDIVQELKRAMPTEVPGLLSHWLDGLDATERWALLKLLTGRSASASPPGSPRPRSPNGRNCRSPTSRRSGTGFARPTPNCSPGFPALGRGPMSERCRPSAR